MRSLQSALILACAVLMTLTGIGAAMARGDLAADKILCSVTTPVALVYAEDGLPLFDDGGDPVELRAADCLDCSFGATALPEVPAIAGRDGPVTVVRSVHSEARFVVQRGLRAGLARAPPALV